MIYFMFDFQTDLGGQLSHTKRQKRTVITGQDYKQYLSPKQKSLHVYIINM